ncbi:MAG: ABC transporter substrate-binding protein, partial [Pseudomonadota bacterium]
MATDSWSRKVLSQIYQPLYIREPKNLELIPWLAEEKPQFDEKTLTCTIKLRPALWSDGSEFTSEDVAFTGNLIKAFRIPRNYAQWKFVKRIETLGKHRVKFTLDRPQAIFLTRTLTTPIVRKKDWEEIAREASQAEGSLARLFKHKVEKPVGTGPFVLREWREGAYISLKKNKYFFGQGKNIGGRLLGPHIEGMILKRFGTSDAAVLALKKGTIDMFWWGIQPGYLEDLYETKRVQVFSNQKSALYYLGFNLRREPMADLPFRHAVATLVDKDFIIKRILQGYAVTMPSIVPPGNQFWHSNDVPGYGEGLTREARIRKAFELLGRAGYTWKKPPVRSDGRVVQGEGLMLPGGRPMKRITILTPPADYDPHRAMAGIMVQEWLKMIGIPAVSKPMSLGALLQQVKSGRHDFDLFIMGYGQLSLDPDYLRNFFHSSNDRHRGWNMSGYRNPHFDRLADESSRTMDMEKRRELIREMQRILLRDIPYLPLYNPKLVEAVKKRTFEGWVEMVDGIGNLWSFCT